MKIRVWASAVAVAAVLAGSGAALAQPQTKLVSRLDKGFIQAIWCSSILFEESFFYEEGSDDGLDYETRAFEIGGQVDARLLDEEGMSQAEVDEIWALFDEHAMTLAAEQEDDFLAQLESCEANFDTLL